MLRYLKEYTLAEYRKEDILLDQVTYEYIDGFNSFLQSAHNCKNNGAVNLLCCMKNFVLYCLRNEWIAKNPFQYYKLREEHNKAKDHLTKDELDKLLDKPMPNARLERIRDVFVFCSLSGLAFTDADHLRREHISQDENGVMWIRKPREKTAVLSRIPILPQPLALLKKYENDAELAKTGKLLPVPSNQKMNSYLKELASICNIEKTLTTHQRRHSWATVAASLDVPKETIAAALGHGGNTVTDIYIDFDQKKVDKANRKVIDHLNGANKKPPPNKGEGYHFIT